MKDYTRTATIMIRELVPEKEQLPYCDGWRKDGSNCPFRARFEMDGHPVCGVHVGKPGTIWRTWR